MLYPTELGARMERQALAVAKPEAKDSDIANRKPTKRNPLVGGIIPLMLTFRNTHLVSSRRLPSLG